ncbi:MAG: hypothetical protein Q8Q55_00715, partial [Undibacterium sp.]|nr:hypothetical protein [Undibacterium sp.]
WRFAGLEECFSVRRKLGTKAAQIPSSRPFKGRVRVGMGFDLATKIVSILTKTHPHPSLPLEGEGVTAHISDIETY